MPKIKIKWVIAGLVAVVIAVWESPLVPQQAMYCEHEHTRDEYCATDYVTLVALREIGKALDEHGEAITALFTVVLAISTIMLWKVTERLWLAGEAQREHAESAHKSQTASTKDSLDIAKRSADAAVAAQRAWIDFTIGNESSVNFTPRGAVFNAKFTLTNIGNSPATKIRIYAHATAQQIAAGDDGMRLAIEGAVEKAAFDLGDEFGSVIFPKNLVERDKSGRLPRASLDSLIAQAEHMWVEIYFGVVVRYDFAGGSGETVKVFQVMNPESSITIGFDAAECHSEIHTIGFELMPFWNSAD